MSANGRKVKEAIASVEERTSSEKLSILLDEAKKEFYKIDEKIKIMERKLNMNEQKISKSDISKSEYSEYIKLIDKKNKQNNKIIDLYHKFYNSFNYKYDKELPNSTKEWRDNELEGLQVYAEKILKYLEQSLKDDNIDSKIFNLNNNAIKLIIKYIDKIKNYESKNEDTHKLRFKNYVEEKPDKQMHNQQNIEDLKHIRKAHLK